MRTHPDIGLLITSLLQDVNKLVAACVFLYAYIDAPKISSLPSSDDVAMWKSNVNFYKPH